MFEVTRPMPEAGRRMHSPLLIDLQRFALTTFFAYGFLAAG